MLQAHEIAEEYDVTGKEVLTPKGWRSVKTVYKTVPLPVWSLRTTKHSLRCSGHHLVRSEGEWIHVRDLIPGDVVDTDLGQEAVTECGATGEVEEMYDITVDDPSHSFYSSGIVSHNSTTIAARLLTLAHTIRRNSSIYITPTHPQLETFAARLKEMEEFFRLPIRGQNVYKKRYKNGSKIDLAYCLTSAKDVRGKTADEVLIDECVAENTLVYEKRNNFDVDIPTRICDIRVGAQIRCFDKETNRITYDRVINKWSKGVRPCWTVRTETGHSVTATANHKFFTDAGWEFLADLRDRLRGAQDGDGEEGRDHHAGVEPACARDDAGDTAGRRLHSESGALLVQEALHVQPLSGAEGLHGGEGSYPEGSEPADGHPSQPRVRGGFRRGGGVHEMQPCPGAVLESVLQQAGGEGGRDRAYEEVCHQGLGGAAHLGSDCLVDPGRRLPVGELLQHQHALVREGGAVEPARLVRGARVQEQGCAAYRRGEEEREDVQRASLQHGGVAPSRAEDRTVRASEHAVQVGRLLDPGDVHVRDLWEGVQDDNEPSIVDAPARDGVLSGLSACDAPSLQGYVPGQVRPGGSPGEVEGAEAQGVRCRRGGETEAVLQPAQGEDRCAGTCAPSGRRCRRGDQECQGDVCVLRGGVRGGSQDLQLADEARNVPLQEGGVQEGTQRSAVASPQVYEEGPDGQVIPVRVVSIEFAGDHPVWDITTERTHTFVASSCIVSNCQNFDPGILEEVLYTTTTSDRPMEVYTGTALTIDTLLEKKWQESSKGCWNVRAMDGVHWLNLYDEETLYKVCDNPVGPVCPYTGKKLVMTDGLYVHEDTRALEDGKIGLHVPQCMITDLSTNPVQWRRIYDHVKNDDRVKVLQECFGIAVAEGSREITETDIMYMCSLTISQEEILKRCHNGYYKLIVSGCDWGGSDYNPATKSKTSYTVHCILGVAPDGGTDILYWHRYAGMQYPQIAASIIKAHKEYNGMVIASDFGVGMAYNTELRNYLPFDRHFIMNYTGPDREPIKENKNSSLGNHIMINRTEAITNVFKDVKSMVPIIRARSWDVMADFFKDWLAMYRIPVELPNGTKTFKYQRAATEADDALHSFTFAYVLVKIYLGKSLVEDMALENRMRAVMRNPQQAAMEYRQQQQALTDTNWVVWG